LKNNDFLDESISLGVHWKYIEKLMKEENPIDTDPDPRNSLALYPYGMQTPGGEPD